ncbi:hypothetical protein [Deinococcus hohokamensis]|uniref:Uncharacterized protein n=1 Tax=Deinococcus hohokamensis TaxID=309883 RepID=A0ABV9I5X6_9DEIO
MARRTLHLTGVPHQVSPEELAMFAQDRPMVEQGMNGTLDALERALTELAG